MKIRDKNPPTSGTDSWGIEPLMDVAELASYLGRPISTVYDWRVHGKGLAAYRLGKHLKFADSDVRSWRAEQREASDRRCSDAAATADNRNRRRHHSPQGAVPPLRAAHAVP
jgi:excisionase family DNA binding protein